MTIYDRMKAEKLQYNINREAAKILPLSFGKVNKQEYLTDKEILPSDQSRIIEQAKFAYSLLGKSFEKQAKTIEKDKEEIKPVEGLFQKGLELMKLKMKQNKLKNGRKRLNERIEHIKQIKLNMIFNNMKQ